MDMIRKKILGLDIGTNSIGWAIINASIDENSKEHLENISCTGSRIIPMDAAVMGDFDRGNTISQTAERRNHRSIRELYARSQQRRERLHRILDTQVSDLGMDMK